MLLWNFFSLLIQWWFLCNKMLWLWRNLFFSCFSFIGCCFVFVAQLRKTHHREEKIHINTYIYMYVYKEEYYLDLGMMVSTRKLLSQISSKIVYIEFSFFYFWRLIMLQYHKAYTSFGSLFYFYLHKCIRLDQQIMADFISRNT